MLSSYGIGMMVETINDKALGEDMMRFPPLGEPEVKK
jgi:hypothetical protein